MLIVCVFNSKNIAVCSTELLNIRAILTYGFYACLAPPGRAAADSVRSAATGPRRAPTDGRCTTPFPGITVRAQRVLVRWTGLGRHRLALQILDPIDS